MISAVREAAPQSESLNALNRAAVIRVPLQEVLERMLAEHVTILILHSEDDALTSLSVTATWY